MPIPYTLSQREKKKFHHLFPSPFGRRARDEGSNPYPCRCLWRTSLQITLITPPRFTILQFLHIFLTDALTFIIDLYYLNIGPPPLRRVFFMIESY